MYKYLTKYKKSNKIPKIVHIFELFVKYSIEPIGVSSHIR